MLKPLEPLHIQVHCHGWNPVNQSDTLLPYVSVTIFVPTGANMGSPLTYNCHTPGELWNYLRELATDPRAVLKHHFNYDLVEPLKVTSTLPTDLKDLFK